MKLSVGGTAQAGLTVQVYLQQYGELLHVGLCGDMFLQYPL